MKRILLLSSVLAFTWLACTKEELPSEIPTDEPPGIDSVDLLLVDTKNSKLPDAFYINSLAMDSQDRLWMGTNHTPGSPYDGLHRYNTRTGQWAYFELPEPFTGIQARRVAAGKDDVIYLDVWPTSSSYLLSFDGAQWSVDTFPEQVRSFRADRISGDLWVATGSELHLIRNGQRTAFNAQNSPVDGIYAMDVIPGEGLWALSGNRILRYADGQWEEQEGQTDPDAQNNYNNGSVITLPDGTAWIGHFNILQHWAADGLIEDRSEWMAERGRYAIFLFSGPNSDSFIASDFIDFAFFDGATGETTVVNPANSALPTTSNGWKAAYDSEGRIWMGGNRALFRLPDEMK